MTRAVKRKPGRPRAPGRAKRTYVSVRRETFRLIEAAAVARGMATKNVGCEDGCAVCVGEVF